MRLSNIANYLSSERNVSAAIQYLALNACISGEPSRVYLARVKSDLTLYHYASFGFSSEFLEGNATFDLSKNLLLSRALQSSTVIIREHDDDYRHEFHKITTVADESKWKSTVFLPLLPDYAATLNTPIHIPNNNDTRQYFEVLRSILSLYLHLIHTDDSSTERQSTRSRGSLNGKDLTNRQQNILTLIKDGKTNGAIASQMGYSESLIRQETMIIYQKLGVNGRRDIFGSNESDQGTNHEDHGI